MAVRDQDPFGSLNRVLDSRHTQPGSIRKACYAVEDCVVNNRCIRRNVACRALNSPHLSPCMHAASIAGWPTDLTPSSPCMTLSTCLTTDLPHPFSPYLLPPYRTAARSHHTVPPTPCCHHAEQTLDLTTVSLSCHAASMPNKRWISPQCPSHAMLPPCRDNLRLFFDKCFPNLLKRIFGYDDFEASWLNLVTKVRRKGAPWRHAS